MADPARTMMKILKQLEEHGKALKRIEKALKAGNKSKREESK